MMTLDEWWGIVERARAAADDPDDCYAVADEVRRILTTMPASQIVAFCQPMWDLLAASYSWDLWAAAYTINGGASDDGFEYFRGWLLTQGRRAFESAVADPDALAGFPAVIDAHRRGIDLDCEEMLGVAWSTYQQMTGEELPQDAFTISYPDLGPLEWDFEDRAEFATRFPRLAALYFDHS
jgi:Protein of unknown function (DUF4240)